MDRYFEREVSPGMLLRYAFPTIISLVFMGIYTTVDGVFVSRLVGTDALSAVNIMFPLISFALAIGLMLGTGGSAIIARKMGEGKFHEARQDLTMLTVVALIAGAALFVIGMVFLKPMIQFLGADETLTPFCIQYGVPILVFLPFGICAMAFQTFFVTSGKANLGLYISLAGGITNIILDYVFIKVLGLGIAGAALATGIGFSIPAIFGLWYFKFVVKGDLYFVKFPFSFSILREACINGASEMVTNLATSITTLLFNVAMMRLVGSDGVASITIVLYAHVFLSSAYLGYALGVAPIISYNYGNGNTNKLKKIYKISLWTIFGASIITFVVATFSAKFMVGIFASEGSGVYNMALDGYRLFCFGFLFMGFNIFSSSMFTALSNGKVSAILSFLRTLVFVVGAIILLPILIGINGIWIAIPVAEVLGILFTIYYFKKLSSVYQYA